MEKESAGCRLRHALAEEKPLQIIGTMNALVALMAEKAGFRAIYLSGAGVANSCFAKPDIGITTLNDIAEEVRRLTAAVTLPLLVDADTGWDDPAETVRRLCQNGAAALHVEDQESSKKCGHLEGKKLVSSAEMCERISAAAGAKPDREFVIIARTDAVSQEGIEQAVRRAKAYRDAGADMIFPEALSRVEEYQFFKKEVGLPVLANLTEFGKTPLFSKEELDGIDMALYPLSVNRAMNHAAWKILERIRQEGSQKNYLSVMQSREKLYELLNYKP